MNTECQIMAGKTAELRTVKITVIWTHKLIIYNQNETSLDE